MVVQVKEEMEMKSERVIRICSRIFIGLFVISSILVMFEPKETIASRSITVRGNGYGQYIECQLQNTKKPGSIMIIMYPTKKWSGGYSVCMKDERGRVIWSENNAISWNGSRTFYLGNDHKIYRIYIKGNGGSGTVATASTTAYNNVHVR